jgi:hypothetical protein
LASIAELSAVMSSKIAPSAPAVFRSLRIALPNASRAAFTFSATDS